VVPEQSRQKDASLVATVLDDSHRRMQTDRPRILGWGNGMARFDGREDVAGLRIPAEDQGHSESVGRERVAVSSDSQRDEATIHLMQVACNTCTQERSNPTHETSWIVHPRRKRVLLEPSGDHRRGLEFRGKMLETEDAGFVDDAVAVVVDGVPAVVDGVEVDVDEAPSHPLRVDEDGNRRDEAAQRHEEPC
jgi:hypothetical protein